MKSICKWLNKASNHTFSPYQNKSLYHTFLPNETMCKQADTNKTACKRIEIKNLFFNKRKERNRDMAAAQTTLRCTSKVRDNRGLIKQYVIQDNYGNTNCLSRQETIKMLKDKQYVFTNLQIDSLGRIVEKKEIRTVNDIIKKDGKILAAFKEAYNSLQNGEELYFTFMDLGERFFTSSSGHQINIVAESFNLAEVYLSEVEPAFERFIIQNGGNIPYKLHIKSKDGVFEGILLSVNKDIEDEDIPEFVKNYLGNKEYYKRSENYKIRVYRIDNLKQLVKCYVAPDMSLITTKQGSQQIKKDSKLTISKDTELKSRAGANLSKSETTSKGSTEPRSKTEETMNLINNSLRIAVNIKRLFK